MGSDVSPGLWMGFVWLLFLGSGVGVDLCVYFWGEVIVHLVGFAFFAHGFPLLLSLGHVFGFYFLGKVECSSPT